MRSVSGTSRREFLQTAAACTLGAAAAAQSSSLLANALARKIKVGQIGLAHAHASKIEAYIKSSDYDVIGVAEESADLKRNAAMQPLFQGMPWLTRDQLLNWPKLEVVLVETDIDHLLEEARACIKAGKHIHLDKPAGHSLPEFEALLREAEERKLMVQMGYMYRYNPGFLLLQEFLQNGWLGEIFEVHAVMSKVVDPINRTKHGKYAGG